MNVPRRTSPSLLLWVATLAVACSTPPSKREAPEKAGAEAPLEAGNNREAEAAALDEAQYRRQAEELAERLGVSVPTWQRTWKARLESLQYLERKQARSGQDREELAEDWNEWYDRREALVDDWERQYLGWLQIAVDKGREWQATLDPLKDFEAAGLGDSADAKLLRARQSRLRREADDATTRHEDARAVVAALRAAEPTADLDALVAKVLAEWQAKGPEERQKLREQESGQ